MSKQIDDDFINNLVLNDKSKKMILKINNNLLLRVEKTIKAFDFRFFYKNKHYYKKIANFNYKTFRLQNALAESLRLKAEIIQNHKINTSSTVHIIPNKSNNKIFTRTLKRTKFLKIDKMIYKLQYIDKIFTIRLNKYLIIKIMPRTKTFIFRCSIKNRLYNKNLGWFSPDFLYNDAMKKVDEIRSVLKI